MLTWQEMADTSQVLMWLKLIYQLLLLLLLLLLFALFELFSVFPGFSF
jgi:hypothetical protein